MRVDPSFSSRLAGQFLPHQYLQISPIFFKVFQIFLKLQFRFINGDLILHQAGELQAAHLIRGHRGVGSLLGLGTTPWDTV